MDTEKSIGELVRLEHQVRLLDELIQEVQSMDAEQLRERWPRILKARQALEIHGKHLPAEKQVWRSRAFSSEDGRGRFRERFARQLRSVIGRMRKVVIFLHVGSRKSPFPA